MIKYEKTRLETEMEIVEKVEWEKYLVLEKSTNYSIYYRVSCFIKQRNMYYIEFYSGK